MSSSQALERRVANLQRVIQVNETLRAAFDLPTLLQQIIGSVIELVDCEKSSILLVDQETGELHFTAAGADYEQMKDILVPRQGSIAGAIVETRQPRIVLDAPADPQFFSYVDEKTDHATVSLIGVPLEIGGRVIGVMQALNKQQGQFDNEDLQTLLMFAPQAAAAIENTRLIQEQRERLAEVLLIQDVVLTLSRFMRIDQLLAHLLLLLEESLGYRHSAVFLLNKERTRLRVAAHRGIPGPHIQNLILPIDEHTASGRAFLSATPCLLDPIEEPGSDEAHPNRAEQAGVTPLLTQAQATLSLPLIFGEADDPDERSGFAPLGVITLESTDPQTFGRRDVRLLSTIATQTALGIRQAELYENSRRANRLKQEFIATMSHELRTPMTVLIGYCDMLAKESLGPLNEAQLSALKVIRDRSELLLRLLNDVLDFSKIASGDLQLHPVLVNLTRAVEAAVARYKVYADRKHQTLTVDIPRAYQYVIADDQRLQQILGHLIENAIKFSPENRPVQIRSGPHDDDYVRVDVIDQGIGIRPEDREIIFDDFRQLDNSFTREYGGAGMGLAVSKHLIELQGGMIWVESEFGQGSTFSFVLPRPKVSGKETVQISVHDLGS